MNKRLVTGLALALALLTAGRVGFAQAFTTGPAGRDLSIGEALDLARANSDAVKAREAALGSARSDEAATKAAFLPKVGASISGAYLVNPPTGITIDKGSIAESTMWAPIPQNLAPGYYSTAGGTTQYSGPLVPGTASFPSSDIVVVKDAEHSYFKGNLSFTQPLFAWGKIKSAVDIAGLEVQIAIANRDGARLDAARAANRAYYSAKLALDSAAILAELRSLAGAIVADRAAAVAEGMVPSERLLSARSDLAQIEARIVEAGEAGSSALLGLEALTGLPFDSAIRPSSDYRGRLPAFAEADLVEKAGAASTDAIVAGARLTEAGSKIDLEKGGTLFKPDLAFFASLDASGQTPPLTTDTWKDSWTWDLSLGLSVSATFFDGGRSAAKVAGAVAGREAAKAALHGAQTASRIAARQAIEAARKAEAALRAAEAKAAWTAEVLANARQSSADQMISRQELNGAAIQDAGARLDLTGARYALEEAIADLERLAPGALR
jgi:outer membrane protein TolC